MNLIDRDELNKFPIRWNHYDKENGNEHFIYGIETVLEYADHLPTVEAIPIEWLKQWEEKHKDDPCYCGFVSEEIIKDWEKENGLG